MPLDPSLQTLVKLAAAQTQVTPREPMAIVARERAAIERARSFLVPGPEPVASIEGFMIPGPARDIPVCLYKPEGTGPFPVRLFFHGGWAWGDLDTHAPLCRPYTRSGRSIAGVTVIAVAYDGLPAHHAFMYMRNLVPAQADQAFAEAIQALRTAFASNENKI